MHSNIQIENPKSLLEHTGNEHEIRPVAEDKIKKFLGAGSVSALINPGLMISLF
jgi:hypothetical protein